MFSAKESIEKTNAIQCCLMLFGQIGTVPHFETLECLMPFYAFQSTLSYRVCSELHAIYFETKFSLCVTSRVYQITMVN